MLMHEQSLANELAYAVDWLKQQTADEGASHQRACLAVCGFSQMAIEDLGDQMKLPVLAKGVDMGSERIFLSSLEQTKGFEFDIVIIANCSAQVMPHPNLPPAESIRDLCRLYVAMTRAKTDLILTYNGTLSRFVDAARELFIESEFCKHVVELPNMAIEIPLPAIPQVPSKEVWGKDGQGFLRSRDAVGLGELAQQAILKHVTGRELMRGKRQKQLEWRTFGSFFTAIKDPRMRSQVISDEAFEMLNNHIQTLKRLA
jgi:hypothetical protein